MKLSGGGGAYLNALIAGQREWIIGHLYTFTSVAGDLDYFTDLDTDILYSGNIFKSTGLRIEGLKMKVAVGVAVDEQDVTIWAAPTDTIFGANFLAGMAEGIMDGGTIQRDRIVWTPVTGDAFLDVQNAPIAIWTMFIGYMSEIAELGRASVKFKVKSPLVKLNVDMPRNFYQAGCLWSLFDNSLTTGVAGQGCTLLAADYAVPGSVETIDPTLRIISVTGGVSPVLGNDGLPYYQRGRILFTSGTNDGLMTTIDTNDSAALYLAYNLDTAPSPGDTFTIYPGCSKTNPTCVGKFNNGQNFRGFDRVPPVFVSV